jgi:hypothetical protein
MRRQANDRVWPGRVEGTGGAMGTVITILVIVLLVVVILAVLRRR